ncbi:heterokaryon incompatibility protein-domain-containing protein [Paraphoma chrysanthemicola]|uniref:Heterokaryon incompatibility protein-domain-containing protein n=1 Tax=Paraphoma chrysanthemicola TaxID=798071 RepID=A0A8K0RAC5_9PLEO|nr:heterokaryon incompatibility protein-domain-containing protein [Paraphoma chrysanthemicola]
MDEDYVRRMRYRMTGASPSICKSFDEYLRMKEEKSDDLWLRKASFGGSLECGCEYCVLICNIMVKKGELGTNRDRNRDAVVRNSGLSYWHKHEMASKTESEEVNEEINMDIRTSGFRFKNDSSAIELFVVDRADDPILPVAGAISGYTGSEQAVRTAWSWFENCVKTHNILCPQLVPHEGFPRLPLRVIEVGTIDSKDVRLIETKDQVGCWACLSHCWGGQQPLVTKRDTLRQRKNLIPWEDLPKTFQDAIYFTRKFQIPYLWIDSLCIVQDDKKDWEEQSAQMANIYHKSILTLAASVASGPQRGMFRHADTGHLDRAVSDLVGDTKFGKIRYRRILEHNEASLPLLQRGWVHQERLLSPRILHFGQEEMIWECMQHRTCECSGSDSGSRSRLTWLSSKDRFHRHSLSLVDWKQGIGPSAWQAVISDYSRMALTNPNDIFPAISGLAKSVISATGWEYIAGLWKENILVDLVWYTAEPLLALRCTPWRAPSFTWASIMSMLGCTGGPWIKYDLMDSLSQGLQGRVTVANRQETLFYATLVESSCVLEGEDPTGQLRSGYIILKGMLIRARLCRSEISNGFDVVAHGRRPRSPARFRMDYDLSADSSDRMAEGDEVFSLKLIGTKKRIAHEDEEFLVCLILREIMSKTEEPVPGSPARCFQRIGVSVDWSDEDHLEIQSQPDAISRDVLVKIV